MLWSKICKIYVLMHYSINVLYSLLFFHCKALHFIRHLSVHPPVHPMPVT